MFLLQGCVSAPEAPFVPSTGMFYTEIQAPLMTNYNNQKFIKTYGQSTSTHVAYYFLSFAVGEAALNKAIKDGFLKNVAYADYEWFSILGMYGKLTVTAYGNPKLEEN